MNYYDEIVSLNDEERHEYVKNRINELEELAKKIESGVETIGYGVDYNLVRQEENEIDVNVYNIYKGYIKKGTRVVFGLSYIIREKLLGNSGYYYYIDTDEYIYEFCDWIKDITIESEIELFLYIQKFIKKYFGTIPFMSREKMFELLYKDDNSFYSPVKEHGLSWFKAKGNAQCSEYAVLAQNLLSFFGMDSYLLQGEIKEENGVEGSHAFNFISCTDDETGKNCFCLLDFSMPVVIFDMNFEYKGEFPFSYFLEDFDEDDLLDYYDNSTILSCPNHMYIIMNNNMIEVPLTTHRDYYINHVIKPTLTKNR